jgi:hypothetical protein
MSEHLRKGRGDPGVQSWLYPKRSMGEEDGFAVAGNGERRRCLISRYYRPKE